MAMTIIKGEDVVLNISLREQNGNPYDLTGKTITIKSKIAGSLVTFDMSNDANGGITIVNAVQGKVAWPLSDTRTETLKTGVLDFDVYIQNNDITKIVKMRGQVTVDDRIR